jgi:O-antigen/teichoic acid export membrane protein
MVNKIKQDLFSLSSSKIIVLSTNGLFWFLMALILPKEQYGELTFLLSTAYLAGTISRFGLDRLIIVFGAKKESVLFPSYVIVTITSSLAAIIVYYFTNDVFVGLLVVFIVIFELTLADFISKSKYQMFSIYEIIRRSLSLGLSILLFFEFGIMGIFMGFILANLLGIKGLIKALRVRQEFSNLKQHSGFIFNTSLIGLIASIDQFASKILIGSMFGFSLLGSIQVSFQYLIFLGFIPSVLALYLLPQESQGKKNKKLKIYSIIICIILSFVSILTIPFIVNTLLPEYTESISAMQIMSFSIIPSIIIAIIETSFIGNNQTKFTLIAKVIQVCIFFGLIMTLGKQFGLDGLAYSFLIAVIIMCASYVVLYIKYFKKN